MCLILAAIKPDDARWILVSCAVIALLVIVGGLGVWYYRKRVLFSEQSSESIWSFDDLRRMRDRGDLSEDEYQSLRAALIGSFRGKAEKPASQDSADAAKRAGSPDSSEP